MIKNTCVGSAGVGPEAAGAGAEAQRRLRLRLRKTVDGGPCTGRSRSWRRKRAGRRIRAPSRGRTSCDGCECRPSWWRRRSHHCSLFAIGHSWLFVAIPPTKTFDSRLTDDGGDPSRRPAEPLLQTPYDSPYHSLQSSFYETNQFRTEILMYFYR